MMDLNERSECAEEQNGYGTKKEKKEKTFRILAGKLTECLN